MKKVLFTMSLLSISFFISLNASTSMRVFEPQYDESGNLAVSKMNIEVCVWETFAIKLKEFDDDKTAKKWMLKDGKSSLFLVNGKIDDQKRSGVHSYQYYIGQLTDTTPMSFEFYISKHDIQSTGDDFHTANYGGYPLGTGERVSKLHPLTITVTAKRCQ